MNVLLVTLGSGGDVYPFVAVARELQRRGHGVRLMTNPKFEAAVTGGGVEFVPLGKREDYETAIAHPDLVHHRRSPQHVLKHLVFEPAREMYTAVRRTARQMGAEAVVRHHICFAAGWAAERERMADVPCVLAPVFWLNWRSPSVFGSIPFALPRPLARVRVAVSSLLGRAIIDKPLNVVRRELELPPLRDQFAGNSRGGTRNLALWSPTLRGALEGDPQQGVICGAAVYDAGDAGAGAGGGVLPEVLERFVADGPPPVCFTLGTSVAHHAPEFYHRAAHAVGALKLRAIFVTGPGDASAADEIAAGSGGRILRAGFVPYSALFPRCAAAVHHGGIGTVHACLAAGIPQLVVPFANDEFDNAARISRLGCGSGLRATKLSDRALAAVLALVTSKRMRQQAADIGLRVRRENGARAAAVEVERVAAGREGREG